MESRGSKSKNVQILDRPLSRGKSDISLSSFAFLYSEYVQYCTNRVTTIPDLQNKLAQLGNSVGFHLVEILNYREKNPKRENKLINTLLFLKGSVWKSLFGKEADKLERADDDEKTYLIIENEPLVNRYISVPKDKSSLNCAAFMGGIVEALLNHSGFPCKVTAHWHKGSTLLIKFEDSVMQRENAIKNM